MGTFLLDGFTAGTWRVRRAAGRATLAIEPWEPLHTASRAALADEAAALLTLVGMGDEPDLRFEAPGSGG
jgi:hypothetical protein